MASLVSRQTRTFKSKTLSKRGVAQSNRDSSNPAFTQDTPFHQSSLYISAASRCSFSWALVGSASSKLGGTA